MKNILTENQVRLLLESLKSRIKRYEEKKVEYFDMPSLFKVYEGRHEATSSILNLVNDFIGLNN